MESVRVHLSSNHEILPIGEVA